MFSPRRYTVKKGSSKKRKKKKAIDRLESEVQIIKEHLKDFGSLPVVHGGLSNNHYVQHEDKVIPDSNAHLSDGESRSQQLGTHIRYFDKLSSLGLRNSVELTCGYPGSKK